MQSCAVRLRDPVLSAYFLRTAFLLTRLSTYLALFPGHSRLQSLITCNMQLDSGGTLAFVRKNRVEASFVYVEAAKQPVISTK